MPDPFHDAFDAALAGNTAALAPWLAGPDAGLAVYRNTVARGAADVLAANFPAVERLVGEDWFRAAAVAFAGEHPPADPAMNGYGEGFPAWLETFPPARELPYLAPVARLDRAFAEARDAADTPAVSAAEAALLKPDELFAARAEPHPAARLFWFDWSVASIWLAERGFERPARLAWARRSEGLLITRPAMVVEARRIGRAAHAFLAACRRGRTLGAAASAALATEPRADLRAVFAGLIAAGAFSRLILNRDRPA